MPTNAIYIKSVGAKNEVCVICIEKSTAVCITRSESNSVHAIHEIHREIDKLLFSTILIMHTFIM